MRTRQEQPARRRLQAILLGTGLALLAVEITMQIGAMVLAWHDELWDPCFSRLSAAEYGAFRRILAMFARSKRALKEKQIVVTAKELKMHGITLRVLKQLCANVNQLEISLLTESGEIKDLKGV